VGVVAVVGCVMVWVGCVKNIFRNILPIQEEDIILSPDSSSHASHENSAPGEDFEFYTGMIDNGIQ
jgi:hypothetical protein